MNQDTKDAPSWATDFAVRPLTAEEAFTPYTEPVKEWEFPDEVKRAIKFYNEFFIPSTQEEGLQLWAKKNGKVREKLVPNDLVIEDDKPIPLDGKGPRPNRTAQIVATLVDMKVGQSVWSKGLDERTYFYQLAAKHGIKIRGQREGYGVRFWRIE